MKIVLLSTLVGASCAFAPSSKVSSSAGRVMSTPETVTEVEEVVPTVAPINGWVPDSSKPCYGLPGATAPFGFFDPVGFTSDMELNEVKRFREAEIMHGRGKDIVSSN